MVKGISQVLVKGISQVHVHAHISWYTFCILVLTILCYVFTCWDFLKSHRGSFHSHSQTGMIEPLVGPGVASQDNDEGKGWAQPIGKNGSSHDLLGDNWD